MAEQTTRTLFAEVKGGDLRKIVIPTEWVITFGPIGFGASRQQNGGESPNVLRIYTDTKKTDLVAVYRDIVSVSDERVTITQKSTQRKQKVFTKRGANGEQSYAAEIRKTVWRNPFADEPEAESQDLDDDILSLPAGMTAEDSTF